MLKLWKVAICLGLINKRTLRKRSCFVSFNLRKLSSVAYSTYVTYVCNLNKNIQRWLFVSHGKRWSPGRKFPAHHLPTRLLLLNTQHLPWIQHYRSSLQTDANGSRTCVHMWRPGRENVLDNKGVVSCSGSVFIKLLKVKLW